MKLLEWFKGKTIPGDEEPYVPISLDIPATPRQQYLLCACIHFSLSVLMPILFFTIGGRETDESVAGAQDLISGEVMKAPAEVGFVLFHFIQALQWPMSWVLGFLSKMAGGDMFAGILGYVPVALNSLLCAIPIYYAYRWLVKWRESKAFAKRRR